MVGHLAKVVRSLRCMAVCDYGPVCLFTCVRVRVFLSGCLSRQMLHLTFQHSCGYRGGVMDNSTSKLNKCVHFLTGWRARGGDFSVFMFSMVSVYAKGHHKMQLSDCVAL